MSIYSMQITNIKLYGRLQARKLGEPSQINTILK